MSDVAFQICAHLVAEREEFVGIEFFSGGTEKLIVEKRLGPRRGRRCGAPGEKGERDNLSEQKRAKHEAFQEALPGLRNLAARERSAGNRKPKECQKGRISAR